MVCFNATLTVLLLALAAIFIAVVVRCEAKRIDGFQDECERILGSTSCGGVGLAALVCAVSGVAAFVDARPCDAPLVVGLTVFARAYGLFCSYQIGKCIGIALLFRRAPKSAQDVEAFVFAAATATIGFIGSACIYDGGIL